MLIQVTGLDNRQFYVNTDAIFTVSAETFEHINSGREYTRVENMVGNHVNVKESVNYFAKKTSGA